jgi:ABC-2 type transport system permease protein
MRATRVELLKLRRTLALWLSVLIPLVVIAFTLLGTLARDPGTRIAGRSPWDTLVLNFVFFLWCLVGLPLFVALETALLAGLEHQENTWKHLFALPVPRWSIYGAKLLVGALLIVISSVTICIGVVVEGLTLHMLRPDLGLDLPVPWATIIQYTVTFTLAALLILALQTWVATRWHSFTFALGLGIAGTVAGLLLGVIGRRSPGIAGSFPWTLPFVSFAWPEVATTALLIGVIAGVAVAILGCWDVCRRDVA